MKGRQKGYTPYTDTWTNWAATWSRKGKAATGFQTVGYGVRVQACPTASGAGDMVFASRRAPQHPELAWWHRVTEEGREGGRKEGGVVLLWKSRDPGLAGKEKNIFIHPEGFWGPTLIHKFGSDVSENHPACQPFVRKRRFAVVSVCYGFGDILKLRLDWNDIHTYMHTYIHTCIHTKIQTYIHIHTFENCI